MAARSSSRGHGGRVTPFRPRLATTVVALVAAMTATLLPLAATASAQTTSSKAPSAPTPPTAGQPQPDTTPPADHPLPTAQASAGDPAKVLPAPPAQAAGTPGQEVVGLRTATSKTFVGDHPGELRTEVHTGAIHFKDAKGQWVDINTDLTPSKSGRRQQVANGLAVSLADSATDASLVNIGLDATHSVGFSLDGAAKTTAKADSKSVTYAKALNNTDVKVTSRATGVKDELVLASPAAPDRFVFPLQLRGLTASIDANGDVVYRDEAGQERARTPHGFMTDANVDPRSGEAPMSTDVAYALIPWGKGDKGVALEVRVNRAWLNDPARQYPVTVDPQIANAASADDTYVMSGFYADNSYDTVLKVGTYDGGSHIGRAFMHFDTSAFTGATVSHAELHLAERHSWDCSYQPEPVWRVGATWQGRAMPDWSNQPPTDPNPIVGGVFANAGCDNRLAVWDVTSTAAGWAADPNSSFGLSLRSTNEGDNSRYKKYASTEDGAPPALIVTYNHAPITPVSVSPANMSHIIGSTTTLSATYADADGGSGQIAFGVWNANSQLVWSAWSGSVCTWCATSVSVPALADGWYFVQTIGYDGQAYSPAWSPQQWFFLDTRPPTVPTAITPAPGAYVGSPATVSARYSEPYGWSGNVLFDIITSSGGQGPVVWSATTCNGCVATVTLPAMAPGAYTLYVLSYDGASSGWAPTQTLNIGTAPAAPTGLQAVAGALSALLSWTAPSTNGGPITGYTFTATDTAGGAPIQSSCTACTGPFTMGGLTPGHNYTFTAQATNAVGSGAASAPSNVISALLASVLTPTNVAATRGDTTATVTWTAPTVNVPGITGYSVTAYKASDGTQIGTSATTTATTYTWPAGSFRNGTPVNFKVASTTLIILTSPASPLSNTVTPAGAPFAPTGVNAIRGNAQATVTFAPPAVQPNGTPGDNGDPISGYTVTAYQTSTGTQAGASISSFTSPVMFGGLTNGIAYNFKVQAINGVGAGTASTTNTVTPAAPPDAPTNVTAVANDGRATVNWTAPPSNGSIILGYTVSANPLVSVAGADSTHTTAVIGGLANGTSYTFNVVANSDVGDSAQSADSNGVTPSAPAPAAGVPGPPPHVVAFPGDRTVTVRWSPADPNGSSITRYTIAASPGGTVTTTGGSATQANFSNLSNGTPYTFSVFATNALGNSSTTVSSNIATPAPTPPPIDVVLGDSYSSGEGAPPFNDQCDRSDNAYGPQYARSQSPSPTLVLLACTGAVMADVTANQLAVVPSNTDNVFMTIGGNDVQFRQVITACVKQPTPCDQLYPREQADILALRTPLAQLYRSVQSAAPSAHVYVLAYPHIFTNTGRVDECTSDAGINPAEKDWLNARATDIDTVIGQAAGDAGVTLIHTENAFSGHEVCTPNPWSNGIVGIGGDSSFHPKTEGYQSLASLISTVVH